MKTKGITSRQYFRRLTMVYYGSTISLTTFVIMTAALLVMEEERMSKFRYIKVFFIVIPLLAVAGYFGSKVIFKQSLDRLKYKNDLIEKMRGYRSALITKYTFLALPAFFAIVASLITVEKTFLSLSMLLILVLFVEKPSATKAAKELDLHSENAQIINNPNKIIA
jgi:hypothetical protein